MPPRRTNPSGYRKGRLLRKNPTDAEIMLWKHLRAHRFGNVGFRRQHAIGPYIVDFCSPRLKIVIELDGGQHAENKVYDKVRSEYLSKQGYYVMRFWNNQVLENLDGVLHVILERIMTPWTPPIPPQINGGSDL
jgi:very-short-patch-repair endonuclease